MNLLGCGVSVSCESLINFLTDYLEGRLPLRQRAALEIHLLLCRTCRDYLHNFRATIQACRAAQQPLKAEALTTEQARELVRLFQHIAR